MDVLARLRRSRSGGRLAAGASVIAILAGALAVVSSAGFSSSSVAFPPASAWLLTKAGGTVRATLIDARAGERVFKPVDLGAGADSQVELAQLPGVDPAVVAGTGSGGDVASRLDPASGTKAASSAIAGMKLFVAPGRLVGVDTGKGSVSELDPRTFKRLRDWSTSPAGTRGFDGYGDESGTIWLLNHGTGDVVRVPRVGDPKRVSMAEGGAANATLTSIAGVPVVVDPDSGSATELDPSSGTPHRRFTFDGRATTVQRPQLHVNAGAMSRLHVVAGTKLVIVDPGAGRSRPVELGTSGEAFGPPVVVDRTVYVPDPSTGRVVVVRGDSGEIVGSPKFLRPGRPIDLVAVDGNVLAHDPTAANGFVLGPDGLVKHEFQKVDSSTGGNTPEGGDGRGGGNPPGEPPSGQPPTGQPPSGDPTSPTPSSTVPPNANANPDANSPSNPGSPSTTTAPNGQLQASFTGPAGGQVGSAIGFTDTSTGGPTGWQWNFGDGTTATSRNPSKIYNAEGTYTVTLTVSGAGRTSATTKTVSVAPLSPLVAGFSAAPSPGTTGAPVAFTDTSTGGPTSWSWDFGDGATSSAQNPSHAYGSASSLTVTLTVNRSSDGSSNSTTRQITINPTATLPSADFTPECNNPDQGYRMSFTWVNQVGVNPSDYFFNWAFDEGGQPPNGSNEAGVGGQGFITADHYWVAPGPHSTTLTIFASMADFPGNPLASNTKTVNVQAVGSGSGGSTTTTPPIRQCNP